eukprot:6174267-Pleurochrysis_carterae.AAC.1
MEKIQDVTFTYALVVLRAQEYHPGVLLVRPAQIRPGMQFAGKPKPISESLEEQRAMTSAADGQLEEWDQIACVPPLCRVHFQSNLVVKTQVLVIGDAATKSFRDDSGKRRCLQPGCTLQVGRGRGFGDRSARGC